MDSQNNSLEDPGNSLPLFPAYSTSLREKTGEMTNDKDWLCNSSYTQGTFQDIFSSQSSELPQQKETALEEIKDKKKKHKKLKKEHSKKQTIQPIISPSIRESDSIRSQLNKKTFIEETGLSFERAYRIDANCDRENVYYDSFEGKKIAKYKINLKTFFGSTVQEQLLFAETTPSKLKEKVPRYFSKKSIKLQTKSASEVEIIPFKGPLPSVNLEFLPLLPGSKSTGSFTEDLKTIFDGVSTSWKPSSFSNEKTEEVDIIEDTSDLELRNKTKMFNKQVAEAPENVQLWLDFVDFQEELHKSNKEQFTESYLIEKKVAILDKALKHNPKSVKLNIAKSNLCRSIWKIEKVIEHWDKLIFMNPNDSNVWQEYVTFVLTDLTYFSVPRILKVFSKCFKTLSNLSEGIIQSHVAPPNIVNNMLDIFSQLCFVLRSCGYTEKAVAAYQALVEFNIFDDPFTKSLSVSEKISCFEPFWDSGAARFGEDGAIGWSATVLQKKIAFEKTVFQSDLSTIEDEILYKKLPEWETWLEFERLREIHHWLPWKPNPEYGQTDDDIDDIDRTVPFDDISKYIFSIPKDETKFLLVHNFINFLGFNPHIFGCRMSTDCDTNTHTTFKNLDIVSKTLNDTLINSLKLNPLYFKTNVWTKEKINFVKNIFSQTLGKFNVEYKVLLSLMWLKFLQYIVLECENAIENMDSVKKFAKNMLKETENRNCLLLWREYIKMEHLSGSNAKAKKTFETLLASSSFAIASGSMSKREIWYFIRSYIDFCLDSCSGNQLLSHNEIIWLLVSIGCQEKYMPYNNELIKPTTMLKAVTGFKSFLNQEISLLTSPTSKLCYCLDPCRFSFVDCAKCLAYLQYFTQGLDSSVKILQDATKILEDKLAGTLKRNLLEQICIFQAEFISYHTKNTTVSMKPLLNYLYDSIEEYPDSTKLLHTLLKWRSASSVVSPTRRFFSKLLKKHYKTEPITWIFAIVSELTISNLISEQSNSNIENESCLGLKWKIRALYERAIKSSCSHIPVLWRSYLKFEMLNNDKEKAKSVFHQAMQNCGWSKELLMDGIECFPNDLKQIIDFMVEKQIRIHTPLEEITLLMEHGVDL